MLDSAAPRSAATDLADAPAPGGWGPYAAFGWSLLVLLLYNVVQLTVAYGVVLPGVLAAGEAGSAPALAGRLQLALADRFGLLVWLGLLAAVPVASAALVALARRRGGVRSGLGLTLPSWKAAGLGLAVTAAVLLVHDTLSARLDRPPVPEFLERAWATAGSTVALGVVVAVLVPIFEELLFRGFLQPSITRRAATPLARFVAVAGVSALWAAIHFHYDLLFDLAAVFTFGVVFGLARLLTGSTLLPIGLHVAVNASAMVEASARLSQRLGSPA